MAYHEQEHMSAEQRTNVGGSINERGRFWYKRPELDERYEHVKYQRQMLSDQEILDRYTEEMLKLKYLNRFGRHSLHFRGYPKTLLMNECRRILEQRQVSIPSVILHEDNV